MTDDNITFMFYTRTLSEDYRVFSGDGSKSGDYANDYAKFEQFERIAQVESDDEASAVVYEGVGRWYLAVFGLNRKSKDRAGREKRFSFCVSFNDTSYNEESRAMRAFSRVVDDWEGIGELADSLIEETPTTRRYIIDVDVTDEKTGKTGTVKKTKIRRSENMRFDYGGFIHELVRERPTVEPPEPGYMLKYFADRNKIVPIGPEEEDDDSGEGYTYRWILGLLLAGVLVVGLLMWYFTRGESPSKPPAIGQEQPSKSQVEKSRKQGNSSEEAQSVTSNNEEEKNGERNSHTGNNGTGNIVDTGSSDNNPGKNNHVGISGNRPGSNKPDSGDTQPEETKTTPKKGEGDEISGH